uniref:FtsJ domain-containing protein n=1 Tax=Panagrellus redivivus TaxID=6233 RepID=A0A7E4VK86_PANRE
MCVPKARTSGRRTTDSDAAGSNRIESDDGRLLSRRVSGASLSTLSSGYESDYNNNEVTVGLRCVPLIPGFPDSDDNVLMWHFPRRISQTRLSKRKRPSSACSLIAAALAEYIYRRGIRMPCWDGQQYADVDAILSNAGCHTVALNDRTTQKLLPERIVIAMVDAILEGNALADKAMVHRTSDLFTVPNALQLLGNKFGEVSFVNAPKSKSSTDAFILMYAHLKSAIEHPETYSWKQLFFLLMFVERCVLVVYQRDVDSIVILDSHTHHTFGAFVATANASKSLDRFCIYVLQKFYPEALLNKSNDLRFEMSMLYFKGPLKDVDTPIDVDAMHRAKSLNKPCARPKVFEDFERIALEYTRRQNAQD